MNFEKFKKPNETGESKWHNDMHAVVECTN